MRKKIYLLAFSSILLLSCNVMDTKPFESYDEEIVWGSKNTIDAFVFEAYNSTVALYTNRAAQESWTPNAVHCDLSSLDGFPLERIDRFYDSGFNRFGALRRCNMIIEKTATSPGLSDNQKTEVIAEGHMLRGLVYFHQAQRMGRFVPIQRVLSPEDNEAFKTPLTRDLAESYEIIFADFEKASKELPEESASGRLNRYAALAYMSEAALQAYSYTKDVKYLDICINSATQIIESGKYSLDSEYGDMFMPKGKFSNEIILGYYRLSDNTTFQSFSELIEMVPNLKPDEVAAAKATPAHKNANGQTFDGWATYFPTQDLVDQYLVIDKVDGKAKKWNQTSQFTSVVEDDLQNLLSQGVGAYNTFGARVPNEGDVSGSNARGDIMKEAGKSSQKANLSELMYQNRDKRFYGTIVYDSCVWVHNEIMTTCVQGNAWAGMRVAAGASQDDSWYTTATGYYWRKGVYEVSPRMYFANKTDYHFVLQRLGKVYMNRAEAYLLKGNHQAALADINMTRTTHGGLPASEASTSEAVWEDYIRERRVEMALENDIYWSYLRWGKYGGPSNSGLEPGEPLRALNLPVHKIQISKDRSRYFIAQVLRGGAWERTFTTRRYLLPIPQGQIDRRAASGIIDEPNPGW